MVHAERKASREAASPAAMPAPACIQKVPQIDPNPLLLGLGDYGDLQRGGLRRPAARTPAPGGTRRRLQPGTITSPPDMARATQQRTPCSRLCPAATAVAAIRNTMAFVSM
jgi:hypothetical protein